MAGWKKLLKKGDELLSGNFQKIVSDVLCNSHDAEATQTVNDASYHKVKTITFTDGLIGNIRVKFDIHRNSSPYVVYGRVYKNGVALGIGWSCSNNSYETKSEDLDVGTINDGGTLELWAKAEASGAIAYLKNFRLYYSNLAAAAATNS
jgi:hypothetical protein